MSFSCRTVRLYIITNSRILRRIDISVDKEGDKICLFGFSRGAYIARALAGMLHKVGLLSPYNYQHVPFAYKMYLRNDGRDCNQSRLFKLTFSRSVKIDFIGVWFVFNLYF